MERLTKNFNGAFGLVKVKDNEQEIESPYRNTLQACFESWQQLGRYEDTGLTPDEIAALRAENAAYKADVEAGRMVRVRIGIPIQKYESVRYSEDWDESPYVECPECGSKVWGVDLEDDPECCPNYCDHCGLKFDLESARAALGEEKTE